MKFTIIPFDGPLGSVSFSDWYTQIVIAFKAAKVYDTLTAWPDLPHDLLPDNRIAIISKRRVLEGRGQIILYEALTPHLRTLMLFDFNSPPHVLLKQLVTNYGATSRARIMDLHNNYNSCSLLDTDTVASFVARLRQTAIDLLSINITIPADTFFSKVIYALIDSPIYYMPATAFQMQPAATQTMDNLLDTFLLFDTHHRRMKGSTHSKPLVRLYF